jgi:hypothetical protein
MRFLLDKKEKKLDTHSGSWYSAADFAIGNDRTSA